MRMNAEGDSEHSNPSLRSRERTGVVSPRPESQNYGSPEGREMPSMWSPGSTRRSPAPDRNCRMRNARQNTRRVVSGSPWMEVSYRNITDEVSNYARGSGWDQTPLVPHYASPQPRRRHELPCGPSNNRHNTQMSATVAARRRIDPSTSSSPSHNARPMSYTTVPENPRIGLPTGVRASAPTAPSLLDWLSQQSIGNDYLLRRILEERDSIRDEYSTVMSERDNVHRELESLQNDLSEAKKDVDTLREIVNLKSSENDRLQTELSATRSHFNSMCLSLMELRNSLVLHLDSNDHTSQPFSTSAIIRSLFEQYLLDNNFSTEVRNSREHANRSSEDSQRQTNRGTLFSYSSSEDEHEQNFPGSLERTARVRAPSSNFSQSPVSAPGGYSSVSLLIEEMGNLRNQLENQLNELEQTKVENESLKRSLRGRESENSSLLLQIERQKREFQKLKDLKSEKVSRILVTKESLFESGVRSKEKITVSFIFPEELQFNWSRFGVLFTNITGNLTVSEVRSSSILREIIRPKYELSKAMKVDVKTLRELESILSEKTSQFEFEFLAKVDSFKTQNVIKMNIREVWTQTPPIEPEVLSPYTSQVSTPKPEKAAQGKIPRSPTSEFDTKSPFTRNSNLRSPLGKLTNDNRVQVIGRNRHRSYSPSMDLNVKYFDNSTATQAFDIKPKRRTMPRQSTSFVNYNIAASTSSTGPGISYLNNLKNNPEIFEEMKAVIEREKSQGARVERNIEPVLSEENIDDMFNFSTGYEDITTEPVTAEDLESNCSVLETSTETGSFRLHQQVNVNKPNFHTNLLLTPDSVAVSINAPTNVLKVSHKQASSEPFPPNEESKQSGNSKDPAEKSPVQKRSSSNEKPPMSKAPRLTWPRMRRNLNFSAHEDESPSLALDADGNSIAAANMQSGDELAQESQKSKVVTKKRPNILSFKFSPVASLRSKSSSKSSNTSKNARVSKASSSSSGAKTSTPKVSVEGAVSKKDLDSSAVNSLDHSLNSERNTKGGNVYDETQSKTLPTRKRAILHPKGPKNEMVHVGSAENLRLEMEMCMSQFERPRTVMMTKSIDEHLGISIAEISGNIMVQRVRPNSLAQSFGIKVGDQILEFNGVNFRGASYNHARAVLSSGSTDITMLLDYAPSNLTAVGRKALKKSEKNGKGSKVVHTTGETSFQGTHIRRVVVIKKKENSSSLWGFSFCGGNTNGLFVSKVMHNLSDVLTVGDRILQVNGISLEGATFEEFFIYLKCYALNDLTIEVQTCPDLFKLTTEMNERDSFYIRALQSSRFLQQHPTTSKENNSGCYLDFEAGDILCVADSLYRGSFCHWWAQIYCRNPTQVNYTSFEDNSDLKSSKNSNSQLVSGIIPSGYLNLGDIQTQLIQSSKNQSDISRTNVEDNEEERRSSFRKFVSKISLLTSGHSPSKSNITSNVCNEEETPPNVQSCSLFEYVKRFDTDGFQRPVLFVGALAELFVQYLAEHLDSRFKLFDQSSTDFCRQSSLETESWLEASSYSVRSSVTKNEVKALRKLCSKSPKGTYPILAGHLPKLKNLIDNELQPLVFLFDPKLSPKTLREVHSTLKNDKNSASLPSKRVKSLLEYGEKTKRELQKLKYFWVCLEAPLMMTIKELLKQLESTSPFVTFAACAPSQLGLEVAKLAVH